MEDTGWVMPTHIVAGAGIVLNEKDKVLELIRTPAVRERYKAFLEYSGRPIYMEYVTKPSFELKLKRLI